MVHRCTVQELISWKHSFKRLSEEYELAKKKKDALDSLLTSGKISQSTSNLFNQEIDDAITEIENQRKALLERMSAKTMELEEQIKTLEVLLAKFEIQHVTGEVDEQIYQRETDLLSMGLETTRQELEAVHEAVNQLSSSDMMPQPEMKQQIQGHELPQPEVELLKEPTAAMEKKPEETSEESVVEAIECEAEAESPETEDKVEDKQE
jgi:hypothetical protein